MMTGKKKEEKKKCKYALGDYKCNREVLTGDEHCIFHSKDIEGKKDKFNDAFWKEFKSQKKDKKKYDFAGFVFPGDISFEGVEFGKDVSFRAAQFSGGVYFGRAQFSGVVYFGRAQFSGEADFGGAQFSGGAYFVGAQFSGEADFERAQFSGEADFENAKFSKGANFGDAHFSVAGFMEVKFFEEAYFSGTQFAGITFFRDAQFHGLAIFSLTKFIGVTSFWSAQFSAEADFSNAKFKGDTDFNYIKIEKYNSFSMADTYFSNVSGLFEAIEKNNKKFKYSNKTEFLPDNFRLILGEEATARYPIISRKIRDDMYLLSFKKKHPKMHFIWWLFADCGRSIFRWALWSILFAVLFAVIYHNIYYLNDPTYFNQTHIYKEWPSLSFLYYSVVTFTTLGFGDIVPKPGLLQFWVMLEVILGYIMLGGLISILANKLARRS
jgi:uncharacterized protein YjbI with pentapeptide repeats